MSATHPSLLGRALRRSARGGQAHTRRGRYLGSAAVGLVAVWALAAAYAFLTPKAWTSSVVLVLPGAGAASSMNVESIGQATSTANAAWSSPDLSPTENYRKMLQSDRLRAAAAALAGESAEHFPAPKVELADQTKLIAIKLPGRSPEQAHARSAAVRQAFQEMLEALRADEIATRDATYRDVLAGYDTRLQEARRRLLEHQARTGLVSLDQYGTIVASLERGREQLRDIDSRLAQALSGVAELERILGVDAAMAANAMVLRADPVFQALLEQLARQDAEIAVLSGIRGTANPRLQDARAERASVLARLVERGADLSGMRRPDVMKLRDVSLRDERARLFERLVAQVAEAAALEAARRSLDAQIADTQARVLAMADDASRLDNLRREVQVAEAVFAASLARIDTGKSDLFASYPMVQTLQPPSLPLRPSSPLPVLAAAGGAGASFLIVAALVLAWLRVELFQRILRNG